MMQLIPSNKRQNASFILQFISFLLVTSDMLQAEDTLECTGSMRNNICSCYYFEDGINVDCQDALLIDVRNVLRSYTNVQSLSIYDLDIVDENLVSNFIPQTLCVRHIHLERTNIQVIGDDAFIPLRKCLETLSIVSSQIKHVPQKAFSGMLKLISIDLSSNNMKEIPSYSFYGLPLTKLSMKGNTINEVSETAFSSLELTLSEINLNENNLTIFPIAPLKSLNKLRSLRVAWNKMNHFPTIEKLELASLEFLDLSYNNFAFIAEDTLKFGPSLKTVSFHFNLVQSIHYRAFYSLVNLQTLDMSHNRLKIVNPKLFKHNVKLEFVNFDYNHLHHIHGLFNNMPSLREVFLSHNNILDVPMYSFSNSLKINTIHLDFNSINYIHSESISGLKNLVVLQLDTNYLEKVPQDLFRYNIKLRKIHLSHNKLLDLQNDTFIGLTELKEIRLNNNNIRRISKNLFRSNFHLEEIHLNHNAITLVEPGGFMQMSNLKYLSLHGNNLKDLNDNVFPESDSNLHSLFLDSNFLFSLNPVCFRFLRSLRYLSLNKNSIKHVTYDTFQNFTQLVELNLSDNQISIVDDLSFSNLHSTRSLQLQNNLITQIKNFTFFGLSELEDLDLSFNKVVLISNMAFDMLKKLRSLNLSYNPLKVLHQDLFQRGLPLSSLHLDNCELEVIENGTFHGLNNLKTLSLKNNSLRSEDILTINISGLKYLALSHNPLGNLSAYSFSKLTLLETLLLEHCNIENIEDELFANNNRLLKIDVSRNILSIFPLNLYPYNVLEGNVTQHVFDEVPLNTFYSLTRMESLNIADNILSEIEFGNFGNMLQLKYLNLRDNEIRSISARKKINFPELIVFDVSFNRLHTFPSLIFDIFPNIININISYNEIVHLNFLTFSKSNTAFINIDLSRNPVSSLVFNKKKYNNSILARLYGLHLSDTNITNIDDATFVHFVRLQQLTLKLNKIRRLPISPFMSLTQLEMLDLGFNKIIHVRTTNFRGLTKLKSLCLANNNIESIESFTSDLNYLRYLDLSYNKIQNILRDDLIHLQHLAVLYLSHNNIKYISVTAFENLINVVHIDLNHNKLQTLPTQLLNSVETHIQNISLKDNALICNCEKNNSWSWIQDHKKIINNDGVTCHNNDYPKEKCDSPVISQLSIDKHKDSSVSVSWFIGNRTAIKGLRILYYTDDHSHLKLINTIESDTSVQLSDLEPNKNYTVCMICSYDDFMYDDGTKTIRNETVGAEYDISFNYSKEIVNSILRKYSSECTSFSTLKTTKTVRLASDKVYNIEMFLNRRMGLMVGCSLGVVVFFIMVSALLYTKIRERKRIAKSDPCWAEPNDYHSCQSKEDIIEISTTASTDNILLGTTKSRKCSLDQKTSRRI